VLAAIRAGSLEPVVSWELAAELVDVLRRPKLRRYEFSDEQVVALLAVLARWLPTVDVEVELRDADDAPVVAAAIAGDAEAIVTGDRHLLENDELRAWLRARSVELLMPAELLEGRAPIAAPPQMHTRRRR
jgi:putative PIN family toxin of toxin-antitoxin system